MVFLNHAELYEATTVHFLPKEMAVLHASPYALIGAF